MALNDTLGTVLSHIHNCEKAGKKECTVLHSKLVTQVLTLMRDNHYIGEFETINEGNSLKIKVKLLGSINKCNVIKPRYAFQRGNSEKFEKRYLPAKGFGIIVVSTSKGVMTLEKSRELNLGGRLLSYIY
ncbi:MAG TPA: 30S ribosomal protein S8 [Candidatus Nanoarchaeia archaeon]|nr:30S ribosomal protein S8 [Candidatus Nanoarchaeia archaeon]